MYIGDFGSMEPQDPKYMPRFPIVLIDDIPLLAPNGFSGSDG
jgi:hypothetical protein